MSSVSNVSHKGETLVDDLFVTGMDPEELDQCIKTAQKSIKTCGSAFIQQASACAERAWAHIQEADSEHLKISAIFCASVITGALITGSMYTRS